MNHLIDTHAHLLSQYYGDNIKEIVNNAVESNITRIINISTTVQTIEEVVDSTKKHGEVFGVLGIHPQDALSTNKTPSELFEKYLEDLKIVAIGEIGFDFYREHTKELELKQMEQFHQHAKLAQKYRLPIIIHSRSATKVTINELKKYPDIKKVVHCFSENIEVMEQYLAIPNTWVSFTGIITFKNAVEVQEAFKKCPLEKMMLETDCPYLAPTPFRGKVNEPMYVRNICEHGANLKEMSFNHLMKETTKNAYIFFHKLY